MAKKRKPKEEIKRKKSINYPAIVLAVLLAISIFYIIFSYYSWNKDKALSEIRINESYQRGYGEGQVETLVNIADEINTRGYISIIDANSKTMMTLVRYNQ